jgi:hypothetical protein
LCFGVVQVLFANLTGADGPQEPSAVLGDKLLAALAFGCPALKTLGVKDDFHSMWLVLSLPLHVCRIFWVFVFCVC